MSKQKELVELLLENGEFKQKIIPLGLRKIAVLEPIDPIQLWYCSMLGFQFSDWETVGFGPVSQPTYHNPLLHLDWIGKIEEHVGTVII